MDRFITSLKDVIDSAYSIFMTPGAWLTSVLIDHTPGLASSLGISTDGNAEIVPVILTILSWTMVALLLRQLRYPLRILMQAVGVKLMRIKYRTLIALHDIKTMFTGVSDPYEITEEPAEEGQAEGFKLNRLDMIVLNLANSLGPGFSLCAPELANRLNLGHVQLQECLEKLSRHNLIDHTTIMTDGFENYRLNETGSYVLTMWAEHRARA